VNRDARIQITRIAILEFFKITRVVNCHNGFLKNQAARLKAAGSK
jgi:hypothetical protein